MALSASIFCITVYGQYRSDAIPEHLAKGSSAVVRESSVKFDYSTFTSAREVVKTVVTAMKKEGHGALRFSAYGSMYSKLVSFSGTIYDRNGKIVKKINKSDLVESELFNGLASDTRMYMYTPSGPEYPYTVSYEYEIEHRRGIFTPPTWLPMPGYNVALEHAEYILAGPEGVKFFTYQENMECLPEAGVTWGNKSFIRWSLSDLPHVKPVLLRDGISLPIMRISPDKFVFGDVSGCMDSWESYAEWQWKLMESRGEMPQELKDKVRELTAGAETDREKAEILYNYLGKDTRYVSIQVGIGGFQPMTVGEVYAYKFGDCKGLSNYMKAMLAECGIESHYVEIGHGSRKLKDYAHPSLTNHAILQLPLDGDTLWLECTNPGMVPFGYTHNDITARKALVYKNGTVFLEDVPAVPDSLNLLTLEATMTVDVNGAITGHATLSEHMAQAEKKWGFDRLDDNRKAQAVSMLINSPFASVSNINFTEVKSATPCTILEFDLAGVATASGSRMYVPVNPFRSLTMPKLPRRRDVDIFISAGFLDVDKVKIKIPEGYVVEALPGEVCVDNEICSYRSRVVEEEGNLVLHKAVVLRRGTYDVSHYTGLREAFAAIDRDNEAVIVLRKEQ